ncbi:UNVERIFIED_ORG: DNA-binding IclR family transcriptional regulator [Arthrobacter sp. UYEF10]
MTPNAVGRIKGREGKTVSKVPGSENTLRILMHLASKRSPMLASRIGKELDIPRSSIYDLLRVMEENGFVQHLREEGRFGLGPAALEIGSAYSHHQALTSAGRPLLASLGKATGESAHLAVLHGRDVLYILEEQATGRPHLVTDVGVQLPSHLTASGRAILAAAPRAHVRALYPNAAAFSCRHVAEEPSITKYVTLSSHLDQVRQRGYATESGQVAPGFGSIAAAVKDDHGWPTAAVSVTFIEKDFAQDLRPQLAQMVKDAANRLSRHIHGNRTAD